MSRYVWPPRARFPCPLCGMTATHRRLANNARKAQRTAACGHCGVTIVYGPIGEHVLLSSGRPMVEQLVFFAVARRPTNLVQRHERPSARRGTSPP